MRKKYIHTDERWIKTAIDDGWIEAFAFWHKVKVHWNRPIIYNFRVSRASEELGVSQSSVSRHVRTLIKKGLAYKDKSGHLVLIGQDKLRNLVNTKKITRVWIEDDYTIRDIVDNLRLVLIRENQKSQESLIRHRKTEKSTRSIKEYFDTHETYEDRDVHIGVRKIGEIVGLSKTGASTFINRAKKRGWVVPEQVIDVIKREKGGVNLRLINGLGLFRGFVFYCDGQTKIHKGRMYLFKFNPFL